MALRYPISKLLTTRTASQCVCRVRRHNTQERDVPPAAGAKHEKNKQTHFGYQTVDEEEKWKKGVISLTCFQTKD